MRAIPLVLLLAASFSIGFLFLQGSASAAPTVSIVNGSCTNGLICLFSINSTQNSHAGACGYYNVSVCANFTTSNIRSNICQLGNVESGVLSLFQVNNTHVGAFGTSPYTNQVCVSPIIGVNVRNSCLANETCLISLNSTNDSHVGDCNYYGNKICLGQADTSTPVITIQSPANTTVLNSWTWANATVSKQASVVFTSLDGAANVSVTNSSGNWNLNVSGLSNGAHKIIFYANDTFNDQASQTVFFTVDTTNLTITVQSPTNVTYSQNSVQAAMTLNRPGTTTALVSLDGAANISLTNTSGSWNTQITGMNNGPHSVTFYANDSAGRVATPVTVFFTVLVRAIAANPNPAWWNDTVIVNGTDAPFSSVSVLLSGATICSTSANSIGIWSGCNFTAPLGVGGYNLTAVVGSSPTYMTLKVKPSYGAVPSGTSPRSVLEIPLVVQEPSGGIRTVISRLIISHGAPS